MLPLLTVLFLVAYCMMTVLIIEQARTIDTQRNLIIQLFDDSAQLSAMKGKEVQRRNAENQAHANAPAPKQAPSSQVKERDSQAQSSPSQVTPQANAKSERHTGKLRKPVPLKPPKAASDDGDERRTLNSI